MPEMNYTPAQKAAVEYRGGNLLLSAAAGSGKTAALILPAAAALILMIVYSIRIWRHLNKS